MLKRASAELAHFEKQLARQQKQLSGIEARVAGKRAEVARLQSALELESNPPPAPPRESADPVQPSRPAKVVAPSVAPGRRTEAIVAVLRQRGGPMTPTEIVDALHAAGRNDELKSVTATLAHLMKADLITRQDRGLYVSK